MTDWIYLDHNATTPCDPRVVDAMLPYFRERFGNPASKSHAPGWRALEAVEEARARVAALLGAEKEEIIWTSGATESNNLALKGMARRLRNKGGHIITVATEHKAVLDPCQALAQHEGADVTILPVAPDGLLDVDLLRESLREETVLVSVMLANNETGVLQPLARIGEICREHGALLHTDAAQAVGKLPVDVKALGVDLLSLSGHKLYAAKGVGALYINRHTRLRPVPLQDGGGHERGIRSGTLNVPGIVGLGLACALRMDEMADEATRLGGLRDRLREGIMCGLDGVCENGHPTQKLAHTLNLSFADVPGESLLLALEGIAVSSGAACTSALPQPSHVLHAMGLDDALAQASIRFSLGRDTSSQEIETVILRVVESISRLREQGGVA